MKRAAPVIVVAVLGLGLGLMIWWITRSKPADPPIDSGPSQANIDFKPEDFIPTFDLNEDGQVTFEEFNQRYGRPLADDTPPLIFHQDNNGPALDAREAFKRWDRDGNDVVDRADMQRIENKAWRNYQAEAEKKRLKAVAFGDRWMMLNEHQLRTYEAEMGAGARDEFPYAGKFWNARYLANWSTLVDEGGNTLEGYLWNNGSRFFLLTADARLSTYDPEVVTTAAAAEDDPHNLYAAAVKALRFDDVEANLELARQCVDWGMRTEAGMLYARVLVFEPANKEALDALGFTENDGHFSRKGE